MKTFKQYLAEWIEIWGEKGNTKLQPNVVAAEAAFKRLVHNPKYKGKSKKEYLRLTFFRPGATFNLKADRKKSVDGGLYKKLAKKFGKQFAFVYIDLIEIDKEDRGKGLATEILTKLVNIAKQYNIPVFLQASNKRGSDVDRLVGGLYKRVGFKQSDFIIPDELHMFRDDTKGPHRVDQDFDDVTMEFIP